MSEDHCRVGGDDAFEAALRATSHEPRLTLALRRAEARRSAALRTTSPERDARRLVELFRDGDGFSAIAAIHALAQVPVEIADALLVDVLRDGDPTFASHAAWAMQARRPSASAEVALGRLVVNGGFTAMVAERTLLQWARFDSAPERPTSGEVFSADAGIVVVQPFLHAQLDRLGSQLGSGDSGGIASLLRSLGAVLPAVAGIDEVITITRRHDGESQSEMLAPGHRVERIMVGSGGPMPWRNGWRHRAQIERAFVALGESLAGRRVVWHLRMADVGTLVAADVARRLGHQVVFTAAPDPHIVIDALQDSGRLDRANFAFEDAAAQFWFRARLVERLAAEADHLVLFPRPTIRRELIELVGLDPLDLARRSTIIAEGVDLAAAQQARARLAADGRSQAAQRIVESMPVERQALPWLLTVGRLHPSKGSQRIVEAVAGDPELAARVNIVIAGGDLDDPSPDERSTVERVLLAGANAVPGLVTLVGHIPPAIVHDLMADTAALDGVYVCASDKEEFGLAIVEALAAGAVVVAPERGGPRTYVEPGDTGVLCNTLSIAALHDAIVDALGLTASPGRADRAREMVRSGLSVERMAAQLGEVYGALVPSVPVDIRRGSTVTDERSAPLRS